MGWWGNLFGRKRRSGPPPEESRPAAVDVAASTEPAAPAPSGETHFFICSGNEEVIEHQEAVLKEGVSTYGGTTGRYSCTGGDLHERQLQAQAADMPFEGESRMGPNARHVHKMSEVLSGVRAGSAGETHVAYASVKAPGAPWVRAVYDELLNEAMSEGVLPYYIYETKDDGAARYLLDSLRRIS